MSATPETPAGRDGHMTAYERKTFSVPVGSRDPASCAHGWLDVRGRCVLCGADVLGPVLAVYAAHAERLAIPLRPDDHIVFANET